MDAQRRWYGTLGWRLLAAFLTVAVGAVALLALVAAVSVDRRTAALVDQLRSQLAEVQALATAHDAYLIIRDRNGRQVRWTR